MDLLQTWIVVGVPLLAITAALFVGRSTLRARLGYVVLLALIVILAVTPGGALSAAFVGGAAVLFVATGRGTHTDEQHREHHEDRRRFTTADAGS